MPFYTDPKDEPPSMTKEGQAHLTYPHEPCSLYSVRGAKFIDSALGDGFNADAQKRHRKKKLKMEEMGKQKQARSGQSPSMKTFREDLDAKVMNFNDGSMVSPVKDASWRRPGAIYGNLPPKFSRRKNGMLRSPLPSMDATDGCEDTAKKPNSTNTNAADFSEDGVEVSFRDGEEHSSSSKHASRRFQPTCERGSPLYQYEKQVYLNRTTKRVRKQRQRQRPKSALANSRRRKVQPPDGGISLFVAAQTANFSRIRKLLHSGHSRATDKNTYHMTALHYIVEASGKAKGDLNKQSDCVRSGALLLQWGANMHAENQVGTSPVSLAAIVSPIMSSLFKRYLTKNCKDREFPMDTRTPGQIICDENRLLRDKKRQMQRFRDSRNKKRNDFEHSLVSMKQDFKKMQMRDPLLLRNMRTSKKARPKSSIARKKNPARWWSSVDLHLTNARMASKTSDKILQWQRELDRRRALDELKPQVLKDYIGKDAVREQSRRKNRLMRYAHAARLDRIQKRQDAVAHYENHQVRQQLRSMAPIDLRQAARRTQRSTYRNQLTEFHLSPNIAPPLATTPERSLTDNLGRPPVGFFTLDSEEDIKEAFAVLSEGRKTIELPVLLHWLQKLGDPPLDDAEVDRLRERISPFAMAAHGGQGRIGSLRIDYERFVDAMVWLSRREDAKDLAQKAMQLNKGAAYY